MDEDLYDEFGNYIGPDLDSEGSEEDEETFQPVRSLLPAHQLVADKLRSRASGIMRDESHTIRSFRDETSIGWSIYVFGSAPVP